MSKKNKKITKQERMEHLQELYEQGLITSEEAYNHITNFMKNELIRHLIRKGYYKNGERQVNFDNNDLLDCYTYVMGHILGTFVLPKSRRISRVKYDPNKGNITSFINTWTKGFCSLTLAKQRKEHKYGGHRIQELDSILLNSTPACFIVEDSYESIEDKLDFERILNNEFFSASVKDYTDDFNYEEWLEGV